MKLKVGRPMSTLRSTSSPSTGERRHPLRPRRGARRGAGRGGGADRRARGARAVHELWRICAGASICRRSIGACWKRCCAPAASMRSGPTARRSCSACRRPCSSAIRTPRRIEAGQNDLFGLGPAPALRSAAPAPVPHRAVRAAGVERGGAPRWRAGDARPLSHRPSGQVVRRRCSPAVASHRIGDLVSERPMPGAEPARFGGGKPVTVGGLIDEVKKRGSRVILTLDDRTGRLEVTLFEDGLPAIPRLSSRRMRWCWSRGMLRFDEFSDGWRLTARRITELDKAREQQARQHRAQVATGPARYAGSASAPGRDARRHGGPGPARSAIEYSRRRGARRRSSSAPEWAVRATTRAAREARGIARSRRRDVRYSTVTAALAPSSADADAPVQPAACAWRPARNLRAA